jgi:hypothetical protein
MPLADAPSRCASAGNVNHRVARHLERCPHRGKRQQQAQGGGPPARQKRQVGLQGRLRQRATGEGRTGQRERGKHQPSTRHDPLQPGLRRVSRPHSQEQRTFPKRMVRRVDEHRRRQRVHGPYSLAAISFAQASGVNKKGEALFPIMPYPAYNQVPEEDLGLHI